MSNAADTPVTTAMRADIERELARRQRELAAEQHHLADIDDTPAGSIRRTGKRRSGTRRRRWP